MSNKRSPVQKDKENLKVTPSVASVLQYESEQDPEEHIDEYEHVSRRTNKRRALRTPPQINSANVTKMADVMLEMRTLFSSLEAEQDLRFRELQATLQKQSEEIKESISFLSHLNL